MVVILAVAGATDKVAMAVVQDMEQQLFPSFAVRLFFNINKGLEIQGFYFVNNFLFLCCVIVCSMI